MLPGLKRPCRACTGPLRQPITSIACQSSPTGLLGLFSGSEWLGGGGHGDSDVPTDQAAERQPVFILWS